MDTTGTTTRPDIAPDLILLRWLHETEAGRDAGDLGDEVPDIYPDWCVYEGYEPDKPEIPDNIMFIINQQSFDDGRLMNGTVIQKPGMSLRFRAYSKDEAYAKCVQVADLLEETHQMEITWQETTYLFHANNISAPLYLGSEKNRYYYALNFFACVGLKAELPLP